MLHAFQQIKTNFFYQFNTFRGILDGGLSSRSYIRPENIFMGQYVTFLYLLYQGEFKLYVYLYIVYLF